MKPVDASGLKPKTLSGSPAPALILWTIRRFLIRTSEVVKNVPVILDSAARDVQGCGNGRACLFEIRVYCLDMPTCAHARSREGGCKKIILAYSRPLMRSRHNARDNVIDD